MASGNIIGKNARSSSMCQGVTGLSYQSLDEFEKSGCKYNSDNFLKYLSAEADEEYTTPQSQDNKSSQLVKNSYCSKVILL